MNICTHDEFYIYFFLISWVWEGGAVITRCDSLRDASRACVEKSAIFANERQLQHLEKHKNAWCLEHKCNPAFL